MSTTTMSAADAAIQRLRSWLKERNPKLTDADLDLDRDLIADRVLDSLSSLDFVLFIEELAGCEIDTSAPGATANFRTLRTIQNVFFSHLAETPSTEIVDKPTSRKSLSVMPPSITAPELRSELSASVRRMPLSYSQARYWYLQQARPETAWNVPAIVHIKGPLDPSILKQSISELIRRHDALRTTFEVVDGTPMQAYVPPFTAELPLIELPPDAGEDRWHAALKMVERECAKPCDLSAGPPWHACLIRIDPTDHVCLLAIEHLIADLESLLTIPRELGRIYGAIADKRSLTVPAPPMQFSDFTEWHAAWLETEGAKEQIAFRRAQFADAKPVRFVEDGRTATRTERENYQRSVGLETTARLEALVADERATPVAIAMSAAATMLHRRFHQDDLVLMMVSSYRSVGRKTTGVLGNFTNQLPLRIKITPDLTFRELLRQIRASIVEAIKHRDVPTQLVFDTDNPLDHPLAAVYVNWMNLVDYGEGMTEVRAKDTIFEPIMMGVGGASSVPLHGGNPPFGTLAVRAVRSPQGTSIFVTTATTILKPGMAKSIAEELAALFEAVAANPDLRVGA